jgi:hypothetical protein
VDGKPFGINFSLFCYVSDEFQSINHGEEELNLTIPKQYLPMTDLFFWIFLKVFHFILKNIY